MVSAYFERALVVVRGGGDLASGVIYRLHRAGFSVVVLELPSPILVRRTVSYGDAIYSGERVVEGVIARHVATIADMEAALKERVVPVMVDAQGHLLRAGTIAPVILVDGRMEKRNLGTRMTDAPLVIALGPGFCAGVDCHAVIETNRGHNLGRVYWQGYAEADTGEPGGINGVRHSRVLRAPSDGHVRAKMSIGDMVRAGDIIATINNEPLRAPFDGVLRGLIHERVAVVAGMKIGDLDPRAKQEYCFTISDKSLAIGGGVLEAVFTSSNVRPYLATGPL